MVGLKEVVGNDDLKVLKFVILFVVGWIIDCIFEEVIVCVNEVMFRVDDVDVLLWEIDKFIFVDRFNVWIMLSVFDLVDKL